jgi:threonine dehydrogenase-like Zn-dependent dehydrogenase
VIDAVGAPDAYLAALEMVRRGGRIVVVGMYAAETIEVQLGVAWIRGLDLRFAGETPVHTGGARRWRRSATEGSIRCRS